MTYAALTVLGLGLTPAVVTAVGPDLDLPRLMPRVQFHAVRASETTTFHNIYRGGKRTQLVKGVSGPVRPSDIPPQWRCAPLVMLAPLVCEVEYELAHRFPCATVLASLQGWLRQWDDDGRVSQAYWDGTQLLPHVDAAFLSDKDVEDLEQIDRWKRIVPVLIVTMGSEGARVHFQGRWHRIQPFPVREVEPTGAGDVFGAAYLVRYRETSDVLEAARFASCAASFCVEAEGVSGIPTRSQVERRLEEHG